MRLLLNSIFGLLLFTSAVLADGVEKKKISLVFVCDIYNMTADGNGRGGMAKIISAVKAERARNGSVLVAHAGDTISPSLMSGLDRGAHMIDLINIMKPDVFTPGNHEFDFGPDVFKKRMSEAKFPIYAANLRDVDGKPIDGIKSHAILDFDGLKIGVIGLTAEDSVKRSSPGKLQFSASPRMAYRLAGQLRKQGADLIVVVSHASRHIDEQLIADKAADIILSGDDHDLQIRYDGKRAFVEAMEEGLYVAVVDVDVTIKTRGKKRSVKWWPNFRLIDTADLKPDAEAMKRIAVYQSRLSTELDGKIGVTLDELDSTNAGVRGGEAAIGNLFADAIKSSTGADIALLNGGGFRGKKIYAAGSEISRRDILKELPFSNNTWVLEIKGADLRAALEQGLSLAHNLTGAFPQVSGMTIRADVSRPAGNRLVLVKIGEKKLDDNATYKLATNDFLAGGGDGYTALKKAKVIIGPTDSKLIANHVMAYIKKLGKVSAKLEGRIFIARGSEAQ